jgi:glycosyltransferase involved in cell wall biosynthesis
MKIAIDATSLLLPSAGVKNYVHYWLRALEEAARRGRDRIITYPRNIQCPPIPDHEKSAVRAAWKLRLVQFYNIRRNPLIRLSVFGADVFHASQHVANLPAGMKITATVFDMSCWICPEYHTAKNVAATRRYGEKILKACDGLIAISAHARRDAMEILKIPGERIRAIHPGVAEPFFEATAEDARRVGAKYELHSPYLLFVGCIEPRKNVPNLIRAYRRLPEPVRRDVELVVAGPFGWADEEVRGMLGGGGVRYLGYVPEGDLPGLYGGAAALAYYEGFGLPAAQAMAAGVPVIASNRSCLPEVVGEGGVLVDPSSVEELTQAIVRVLTSPGLARELAAAGRARAARFHWGRCAEESLGFFREVVGG